MPVWSHISATRRIPRAVVALALCVALPATAQASPASSRIKGAQKQAQVAREKLDDLSADLEERTEDYLEADDALQQTRARIRQTEAELEVAQQELDGAEVQLNGRASAIYRNGPVDVIAVLVGATDFRDLVTRLDLMRRVGRNDAQLVADVKRAKDRIEKARATLERRREEQTVLRQRAREKQAQMQEAFDAQKAYLRRLDATVRTLIAEEKERQERLARERAAQMLATGSGGGRAGRVFDPDALGEPHEEVVALTRRYVGRTPYVWGGTSPSGFDCSGLVQYCYRELGINLPRTSRQQYRVGAYIPPDRLDLLRPGDLVFFGRDGDPGRVHHVACYSGDGMMVHAPQTGEMVSETSLLARIQSRGDYVGAVRP